MKRKRNTKIYDALTQKMPDYLIKAGWFEKSKYDDGTPIGGIAAVQNYGAKIKVTEKMRAFFRYEFGVNLRKSTQEIIIPPTHFMENCQTENKEKWKNLIKNLSTMFFLGKISPDAAMEQLGSVIEGDIVKQMANGNYPPVTRLTLDNKLKQYKNQKTIGQLGQRFQTKDHTMIDTVSHQVEKL